MKEQQQKIRLKDRLGIPPRVNILEGVSDKEINRAKKSAAGSKKPLLTALPFTESNYRLNLIYDHIRLGQINPQLMRNLRRSDLEFIAGMDFAHIKLSAPVQPGETEEDAEARHTEYTKLMGNVARAKTVLRRRDMVRAALVAATAAILGALIGLAAANVNQDNSVNDTHNHPHRTKHIRPEFYRQQ